MSKADNFIGKVFGKLSQLTVIGWDGLSECQYNGKRYDVHCSICERDVELFTDAIFKCTAPALRKGVQPCGCSKHYIYSKEQREILFKRKCAQAGVLYEGIVGDLENKLSKTVIKVRCKTHGNMWETGAPTILRGTIKCKICKAEEMKKRQTLPEEIIKERLVNSGNFIEGTEFSRLSPDSNEYFNVVCPICSDDKYVKAGVGNSVFKSKLSNLMAGYKPCRCGNANLTAKQKIFDIECKCKESNYEMTSKIDEVLFNASYLFNLKCSEHGVFKTNYKSFIEVGAGCQGCKYSGFDPNKPSVLYILKIVGRNDEFVGYGISGKWGRRRKEHIKNLLSLNYKIQDITIFEMFGYDAFDLERILLKTFESHHIKIEGFKRESASIIFYNDIIKLCKDYNNLIKNF